MAEYIKRECAIKALIRHVSALTDEEIEYTLNKIPAADVVKVVRCKDCTLHGHCITEDHFQFARVENPYCCVGKRREP